MNTELSNSEIRGGVASLEKLLGGHYFKPAAVQREYQWGTEQCAALLADFERAWMAQASESKGPDQLYFLGSFVLMPHDRKLFEVFDGLQRLTTLTILFAVMRDLMFGVDASVHARLSAMVHDAEGAAHLSLSSGDQTLANLIQAQSEAIRQRRNLSANTLRARLLSAAGFFKSRLKDMPPEDLVAFSNFILTQVQVGVIEVNDERLARQIFITTNNRGVPLNEPDVLKSQINSIPLRQDVADRVLSSWTEVSSSFDDDEDYTAFLYAIDFIARRAGRSSEGLTGLGEHLASKLDDDGILEWLVDYERRAEVWHWLSAIRSDPKRNDPARGAIFSLFAFDWPEWRPVALELAGLLMSAMADRDKRRVKLLIGRFESLNTACAAITLAETAETERVQLFARALNDIEAARDPSTHALAMSEIRFARISNVLTAPAYDEHIAVQMFRWLELMDGKTPSGDVLDARIERILPTHPEEFSKWEKDFPDADQRWQQAHAWGNLILQSPGDPRPMTDNFRAWKKSVSKEDARFQTTASVLKQSRWGPDIINARSSDLKKRLLRDLQISESV